MGSNLFSYASIVTAAVLAFFTNILGGIDAMSKVLIAFMVTDYLTGVIVAIYHRQLSSEIGYRGLLKKACILICVYMAVLVEMLIPDVPFREAVICFYIANEGISLLENLCKLIPVPEKLSQFFEQLRQKGDGGDE